MTNSLTYDTLNSLELWQRMRSITLDQMRSVKLMNRIDTKYVLSYDEVLKLIEAAADNNYYVQVIDGVRACRYETLYYDTTEREMFILHHNRKLCRQKLRTRTYVESGITFFEIKSKSNR
ncbi:MAG: VTC domain-containing protein, partial [Alistipes sp.]|nr:VTC domain-containing protein [Alistipes sp.]